MWFDIICLIIVLAGFVIGYRRGFLAQMGIVLGILGGIICCNLFAGQLAEKLSGSADNNSTSILNHVMAYVIIFVGCYILGRIIGSSLSKGTRSLKIGFVDNVLGAAFKTLEYILVFSIVLNVWISVFPSTKFFSNYTGVKSFVLGFAPTLYGSPAVTDLYSTFHEAVSNTAGSNDTDSKKAH